MKIRTSFFLLPLFFIWLTGCYSARVASKPDKEPTFAESIVISEEGSPPTYADPANRKLLYQASLSLVVLHPDSTVRKITKLATDLGGYFNQTNAESAMISVPAARLEEALEQLEGMGKVRDKRLASEDVTEAYFDYGIRLENAEQSRRRYLELLAKATNVEETLLVERELERLAALIDRLTGKMNRLDQLEAMATITIRVERKRKLGPLGIVFKGLFAGVKWLFVSN